MGFINRLILFLFGFLTVILIIPFFDESVVHPFHPPKQVQFLKPNAELIQAPIFHTEINGPETIKKNPKTGEIYAGSRDGKIYILKGKSLVQVAEIPNSKINGFSFDNDGNMILADPIGARLIKFDIKTKQYTVLLNSVERVPLKFVNDVTVTKEGIIYFTDSCATADYHASLDIPIAFLCSGRLMKYDPSTKEATTLLKDLCFANGLELSEDESYLLFSNTITYEIIRYWLKGEKAGKSEVFASNLPGFPDNISKASKKGHYWVAFPFTRNTILDLIHPYPYLKKIMLHLPVQLRPIKWYGLVVLMDSNGTIVESLHDPTGNTCRAITSANEIDGKLYLGNTYQRGYNIYILGHKSEDDEDHGHSHSHFHGHSHDHDEDDSHSHAHRDEL